MDNRRWKYTTFTYQYPTQGKDPLTMASRLGGVRNLPFISPPPPVPAWGRNPSWGLPASARGPSRRHIRNRGLESRGGARPLDAGVSLAGGEKTTMGQHDACPALTSRSQRANAGPGPPRHATTPSIAGYPAMRPGFLAMILHLFTALKPLLQRPLRFLGWYS